MKSLFYLFRRYKMASSFNLLGLILAFTGSYILLTQIDFIGSFNHGIKDYEKIRRVYVGGTMLEGVWNATCNRLWAESFSKSPQVESVGYMRNYGEMRFDKDGSCIISPACLSNDKMLTTINAELVDGTTDVGAAIDGGIIIPASLAEKYFGEVMVSGRAMTLSDGAKRTVVGVYKDFPVNSSFSNAVYMSMGDENVGNINNINYMVYIRTKSDANADDIDVLLKKIIDDVTLDYYGDSDEARAFVGRIMFATLPLDEEYLNGYDTSSDNGRKTVFYILQLAVILLLLVALINFANFSMAQAPVRLRGINTRKVMGESDFSLRSQLMAEGVFVCLCALGVSLLAAACIGKWEHIGEYTLGVVGITENIGIVLAMVGVCVIIGLFSTSYSARYITSFQPAMVLKGNYGLNPRGRLLRQMLVGLQFVIAFILVIFVGIIYCQRSYIYNSDYGYDKDEILMADIIELPQGQYHALRSELEKINGIESVSFASQILGAADGHMSWGRGYGDVQYVFVALPVDWKFLRTMGIEIIEGRDFKESDGDVYIINEAMKKKYPKIEVDKLLCQEDLPVLGVCRNFRASSLRIDSNEEPIAFVIFGERYSDWGNAMNIAYIRMSANTDKKALRHKVNNVLASFFKDKATPELKFLDDYLEQTYRDEMRFMTQIEISTLLAFLITIIGVFCLTMFETEYRRKEIAIRKVMGSSVSEILSLFTRRYTIPLIISFLIAAPIGYYVSEQWLHHFAEHTPVHWWIFPIAFITVSIIVLVTVISQSWRVATMNPVESIQVE